MVANSHLAQADASPQVCAHAETLAQCTCKITPQHPERVTRDESCSQAATGSETGSCAAICPSKWPPAHNRASFSGLMPHCLSSRRVALLHHVGGVNEARLELAQQHSAAQDYPSRTQGVESLCHKNDREYKIQDL